MTTPTDPTFNIAGFQVSESFSSQFLQSGSPLANDINSFSHIGSLSDLTRLVVQTYDDMVRSGVGLRFEGTNVLTGRPGISLVATEGNNTIGTIGVSGGLSPIASQVVGILLHA